MFVGLLKKVYHDTGDDCISQHLKKMKERKEGGRKEEIKKDKRLKILVNDILIC